MGALKVLAVDDNEIHCYAMRRVLELAGFDVAGANTGSEALMAAFSHQPDAVLLDIHLPDLNGYEICERLRADERTSGMAIIFHTATAANEPARQHALACGGDAFLTYPIDADQLVSIVRGCVARRTASKND